MHTGPIMTFLLFLFLYWELKMLNNISNSLFSYQYYCVVNDWCTYPAAVVLCSYSIHLYCA